MRVQGVVIQPVDTVLWETVGVGSYPIHNSKGASFDSINVVYDCEGNHSGDGDFVGH